MAMRLQVTVQDYEYREIQKIARSRHMSIADWVRQALESARRREPIREAGKKFDVVRAAVKHNGPTGDIGTILAEIESGYGTGSQP